MAILQLLTGMGGDVSFTRIIFQWVFFVVIFMFVLPKLYFYQIFNKLEMSARKLEEISLKGQNMVIKKTLKFGKPRSELKKKLDRFIDFFMIPPISLDPFGIVKKLEHLIDNTESRFKDVAEEITPKADSEETMNVYMGLQAAVTIHTVAKIVRHYVEMIKKFKNLQFAMLLQMQLPLIEKLVEAEYKGLNAFLDGKAVGDGIGPLVVASNVKEEGIELTPDAIVTSVDKWDRNITFIKAKGPGGRLGKIGDAIRKVAEDSKGKDKVVKIITVDAAQKLEGEKTGTIAEGIGVAMGGPGVQRYKIEAAATELKIPVEAIAIKMSPFEAISPMPLKVVDALDLANELLKERVTDSKKGSHIMVIGVGNTCGVPNTDKRLQKVIQDIKREARRIKALEEKKRRRLGKKKKDDDEPESAAGFMGPGIGGGAALILNKLYGSSPAQLHELQDLYNSDLSGYSTLRRKYNG